MISHRGGAPERSTIFPVHPLDSLPPEVLKSFRGLKLQPEDFYVWHHLAKWETKAPDFPVYDPQNRALLIKVSFANSQAARLAAQLLRMGTEQPSLGAAEETILHVFLSGLKQTTRETHPPQIQASRIKLNAYMLRFTL